MSFLKSLFGQVDRTVMTEPSGVSFTVKSGQSVLEAALAQGIAFPHSCTVGTCGSCKCTLKNGKIREIQNFGYVLSAEELRANIILACQAAPKSDLTLTVDGLTRKQLTPPEDFAGKILRVTDATHDIKQVTIVLDRPLKFDGGQYAQLTIDDVYGARAYSIANAPQPGGCLELEFYIRHVPGGMFTDLLFGADFVGKIVKVHGPSGNFWLRESRAPLLAIAGGSGLAPLLSLLNAAAARNVGRPCVLLFGARAQRDLYAQAELAALARNWNGAFEFVPVLSDEPTNSGWAGARGLVTDAILEKVRALAGTDSEAYLCGPPPMIDAAIPVLHALGLVTANIHFDKFLDGSHGLQRHG